MSDSDRYMPSDPRNPWLSIYPHERHEDRLQSGRDEFEAVRFIRSNTRPADPIFVGAKDHSRVFTNDLRFYWLAERLPGSRYIDLEAGVASLEHVQREIISDLNRSSTNWAVLTDAWEIGEESSLQKSQVQGSNLLDQHFLTNFEEVASFGKISIMRRKE